MAVSCPFDLGRRGSEDSGDVSRSVRRRQIDRNIARRRRPRQDGAAEKPSVAALISTNMDNQSAWRTVETSLLEKCGIVLLKVIHGFSGPLQDRRRSFKFYPGFKCYLKVNNCLEKLHVSSIAMN